VISVLYVPIKEIETFFFHLFHLSIQSFQLIATNRRPMKVPQTDFKLILFHLPNITIVIHDICEHLKKYLQNQM